MPEVAEPKIGAPGDERFAWASDLAVRADHRVLPVVELHLGGLSNLLFGALGIAYVGQGDVDFAWTGAVDFGLGDPELIDVLAHDFDRAVERFGRDLGLGARQSLVGQLNAALQFEPQQGALERDRRARTRPPGRQPATGRGVLRLIAHGPLPSLPVGGENQQQAAVVIVGWKQVGLGGRGHVAFAADADRLLQRPVAPTRTVATGFSPFSKLRPRASSTRWPMTASSSSPVNANEFLPQPISRPSPSHTKKAASGAGVVVVE